MQLYLQSSAHVQRVSRSARGKGLPGVSLLLLLRPRRPSLSVAVQDCLEHMSRHRWNTSERSPVEAYAVVQVVAITISQSGRKYMRMICFALFWRLDSEFVFD
jgi:hypothetical protein